MSFKRAITYSVAINLFFLTLCLIFGDLKFGAIDDYFMAARLTGALGTDYNPHLIFVNAIYGYALLPLYHLFPKIGWYYIGEMFSVFLSFTVIGYVLLQRCGERWGAILAALFTALFASDFYLVVQFTQCASILSAAGMLLFAYGVVEKRATAPFVLGIILMLWGSVMRWQAFLMGMPFFCLGMLFIFKDCWKAKWRVIAGLAILFVGAFAMHNWDQKIYQTPEYADFVKFQGPRATLGDKGNYNKNAVYEDAEELGLSGLDYHMLNEWIWYDTEIFSVDSLKRYTDMIPPYMDKIHAREFPRKILNAITHASQAPLFWTWAFFCLALFLTHRSKSLYIWASFALIIAFMFYLLSMGRLVYRVENGFWLYSAILAIPLFGRFTFNITSKAVALVITIICLSNIATYASSGNIVRDPSSGEKRTLVSKDSTDYSQVFEYIDQNPDKLFLLSMEAFMKFSHHKNPPYLAEPAGSYRRTVSLGYWTPYLPEIETTLRDFNATNPIKDLINDDVIALDASHLSAFLQRHHYDSVAVDTLKTIGIMRFCKYRLVNKEEQ